MFGRRTVKKSDELPPAPRAAKPEKQISDTAPEFTVGTIMLYPSNNLKWYIEEKVESEGIRFGDFIEISRYFRTIEKIPGNMTGFPTKPEAIAAYKTWKKFTEQKPEILYDPELGGRS